MENLAHSLTGWLIARTVPFPKETDTAPTDLPSDGDRDHQSFWVTPTAIVAANLPDFEVVFVPPGNKPYYLTWHRAWSHSLIGIAGEIVVAVLLLWLLRSGFRSRFPNYFRGFSVLRATLVCTLGAGSHLLMDWWNTYGVRPLFPVDPRWIHGDLVFILDPFLWLILAGGLILGSRFHSGLRGEKLVWLVLAGITSLIVAAGVFVGLAPPVTLLIWCTGTVTIVILRWRFGRIRWATGIAWAVLAFYIGSLAGVSSESEQRALAVFSRSFPTVAVKDHSVNPRPGQPWRTWVIVETDTHIARYDVDLAAGAMQLADYSPNHRDWAAIAGVDQTVEGKAWQSFARHPVVTRRGNVLLLGDARYRLSERREDWSQLVVEIPDVIAFEIAIKHRGDR